jgi:MFS family permease
VRPISLLASIILFSTCFWSAGAHSIGSLEASRIVCAWAMACAEVMPGIVVKDIFFLHERGFWMGIYLLSTISLPAIGNICSGLLITHVNWRWHFWVIRQAIPNSFDCWLLHLFADSIGNRYCRRYLFRLPFLLPSGNAILQTRKSASPIQ